MMSLQLIHCKIWLSNVLSTLHFDCYGFERSGLKIITEAAATAVVLIAAAAVVIDTASLRLGRPLPDNFDSSDGRGEGQNSVQ